MKPDYFLSILYNLGTQCASLRFNHGGSGGACHQSTPEI
jgi:hypothetical protein